MNWLKNTSTLGNTINLRDELNVILHGDSNHIALGHWIVYRRYDRNTPSVYYSNRTHEGIGGPAYTYTDTLLKTRRVPINKKGMAIEDLKVGVDIDTKYVYYFEYTVVPKVGDHIFEIEWPDHNSRPVINSSLVYTDKNLIKRVHDYRLEFGNIQYYIVSCEFDEVGY